MAERTDEDRLREEYFDLLPDIRRVAEELEAEIRHCLLPISLMLDRYERLVVSSRLLTSLKNLAGVRASVFPRWDETDLEVRKRFAAWQPDPVVDENGHLLASKYYGYCEASDKVQGEFQILPR